MRHHVGHGCGVLIPVCVDFTAVPSDLTTESTTNQATGHSVFGRVKYRHETYEAKIIRPNAACEAQCHARNARKLSVFEAFDRDCCLLIIHLDALYFKAIH